MSSKRVDQARVIYLSTETITSRELSSITGVSERELNRLIFGEDNSGDDPSCWFHIKQSMRDSSLISVMTNRKGVIDHTSNLAVNIMQNALVRLNTKVAKNEQEITIDEISKIAGVLDKLQKLSAAEIEDAKSRRAAQVLTERQQQQIAQILQNDPFTVPVEVKGE